MFGPVGASVMAMITDRLDSLLRQWLERHADTRGPYPADARATGVIVVGRNYVQDVKTFCARWGVDVEQVSPTVLKVTGRMLPVRGITEIAAGVRR
jgi:hypothetical protein